MSRRVPAATKAAVAARVAEVRDAGEAVCALVEALAAEHEVSRSTVFNWASGNGLEPRRRKAATRDELVVIARHNGCLRDAHAELAASGKTSLSYRQFLRRVAHVDSDYRAAVIDGMNAAKAAGIYNVMDGAYARSDVFGFDSTEIPVMTREVGASKPTKMWITVAVDWASGLVFQPAFIEGLGVKADPNTEAIAALVCSVMIGQEHDGIVAGGVPGVWVYDNALAHLADPILNGFASVGVRGHAIRPGSPWENGPTENAIGVIEKAVWSKLPGYTHHLPTRYGHTAWADEDLLTPDELIALSIVGIEKLNRESTPKRLKGRTRLEAWADDPAMIEFAAPALVRHQFMKASRATYKITKSGVHFDNVYYVADEFHGKTGRTVEVRHLPNDRTFIDVYLDGEFLCSAEPSDRRTMAQRSKTAAMRRGRLAKADHIIKLGAKAAVEAAASNHAAAAIANEDDAPDASDVALDAYFRMTEGADV